MNNFDEMLQKYDLDPAIFGINTTNTAPKAPEAMIPPAPAPVPTLFPVPEPWDFEADSPMVNVRCPAPVMVDPSMSPEELEELLRAPVSRNYEAPFEEDGWASGTCIPGPSHSEEPFFFDDFGNMLPKDIDQEDIADAVGSGKDELI